MQRGYCSCGCTTVHKIGNRKTATGTKITLWSNGEMTSGIGFCIRGAGAAKSRYETELNVTAGWIVLDLCELYDNPEISRLVTAARRAVRQNFDDERRATKKYFNGEKITPLSKAVFKWGQK